jgi:nitrate/nitrite transport system substrate-binding protein
MTVVPPAAMVAGLRRETLDGLCVGEPWNTVAVEERIGFTAITSQEIWRDHPEKVCAFTEAFAAEHPKTVQAVCCAWHEASLWLDEPANRPIAAKMLAPAHYVNASPAAIEKRLMGNTTYGDGRTRDFGDGAVTFSHRNANYPQPKFVTWWLTQLVRWGMAEANVDYDAITRRVARFDLYEHAMSGIGYLHAGEDRTPEMLFDGRVFDPAEPASYARSFHVNTLPGDSSVTHTTGLS